MGVLWYHAHAVCERHPWNISNSQRDSLRDTKGFPERHPGERAALLRVSPFCKQDLVEIASVKTHADLKQIRVISHQLRQALEKLRVPEAKQDDVI